MTRAIVICTTCKHADGRKLDDAGRSAGSHLVEAMETVLAERGRDDVTVQTQACLWNCTRPCSVVLRDDERFSYVTGANQPTREQAEAILAWFDMHGESPMGEVPFRQWPDLMRGHFIARMPPLSKGEKP
jgi:predicted metal-binding protein